MPLLLQHFVFINSKTVEMPVVYLIPAFLDEEGLHAIHPYTADAIKHCKVFFVENERSARRYFKQLWKLYLPEEEMTIDNYEWVNMTGADAESQFRKKIKESKNIGIVSEAGCPGVADPGQQLVALAQKMNVEVKPLVGPCSILLALMASGMNGQCFRFCGYLPIENSQRIKAIKDLETESLKKNCTQLFIETPYRNIQLLEALLKNCSDETLLCIATNITGKNEWIKTKTIKEWKKNNSSDYTDLLYKQPAIFLLYSGS